MYHKSWKKVISFISALSMCICSMNLGRSAVYNTASAASSVNSRFVVDLNANDGRKASYAKNAENWNVASGTYAETTINGVTIKLSAADGGSIKSQNNKKLQLQSGIYPRMTMDGVRTENNSGTATLKLEISGLSDGTHTIRTWHATPDYNSPCGSLSLTVNGNKAMSGISVPANPTDEDNAGIGFAQFSGKSATILITSENNGSGQNYAWLNAFEIDASDPINGISNITPENKEKHFDASQELTWTAGKGAKSQNVYIGEDYTKVMNADTNSAEFMGNQSGTSFKLDDTYSSIPTYYWRVDTVTDSGIVKGSVNSFCIRRDAFQTAEGAGRYARGGRGGYVYHVTNLNDSGEGSLRYGLETLKGARTIVFDVGGVIALESVLCIPEDGGDVYVAGQTAPGDGITLINYTFGALGTEDAVIRDMRVRVGDVSGKSMGGMGLASCNNSIIDHCSISWATDEGLSTRSAANITFQWNIIAESLNNSVHYDATDRDNTERHSFAASIGGYVGTFHHNMLVDNAGRNWSLAGAMEQDAVTYGGNLVIANNVVYNWQGRTTDGGVRRLDFVGNTYKAGASSNTNMHIVSIDGNELNTGDMQKMYVSGNQMLNSDGSAILKSSDDAWSKEKAVCGNKNATVNDVKSTTPYFAPYNFTLDTAETAYDKVTQSVGANVPAYDYLDSRYIKEVTSGTYTYTGSKDGYKGIIDSPSDVGGYPNSSNFKGGTAPKDSDRDGMSDDWEKLHGLDPNNAADGNYITLSADDYTNLEMYLNELAGDAVEYNFVSEQEPISGTMILDLTVDDKDNRNDWSIQNGLKIGDVQFGDREVTFADVPDFLIGSEYIRTAADSKSVTSNLGTFNAGADMTVYVALDSRVTTVPEWLATWTKTGLSISNSNGVSFNLYSVDVNSGDSVTIGTNGQSSGCVSYSVFAVKQGSGYLMGDVNADGEFNIADVVALQSWLLGGEKTLANWKAGNFINDDSLDVFDLCMMKKSFINQKGE